MRLSVRISSFILYPMTKLLEEAFDKASQLEDAAQNEFAEFLLSELRSDERWDGLFARSQNALARMAEEAATEYRAGKTESGGFGDE